MTVVPQDHYNHLAALLDYPQADYSARVRAVCGLVRRSYPSAVADMEAFAEAVAPAGESYTAAELNDLQEVFTRTFDVQPITTLGVGYVMFGDDYKRGELLVNLSREEREAAVDCGCELADHLPNVLRLMARWQDCGLVDEFVREILHPALERMIAEFGPERMVGRSRLYKKYFKTLIATSSERGTVYRRPLRVVLAVVKADFDLTDWVPPEQDNDFLRSIGRELEIEARDTAPAAPRRMV